MEDIVMKVAGGLGHIVLDRPRALNAVTLEQIHAMYPTLRRWADGGGVRAVVISATGGKAFSAGGDIRVIHEAHKRGDLAFLHGFYRDEYRLNRLIKTYPKPYVALIDGIVMGGGVGIAIHGSHRVATERTVFAMPETGIGLFPDVGGTFFLPRCPGRIGMYLALTGARLKAADCLYAGLATHHVPAERLPELRQALSGLAGEDRFAAVTRILDDFHADPGPAPLAARREEIDRCFGAGSVEAIMAALERQGGDWAAGTLETLRGKSPTSLKVTYRQMIVGRDLDFDAAMKLEYRMAYRFMDGHDFFEGVRAVIIDKDQAPRWRPASLAEIGDDDVEGFLAPLPPDQELTFDE